MNKNRTNLPKGISYIIGNEAAERYSFYGMKAILFVFLTQYLITNTGKPLTGPEGKFWYHNFVTLTYFTPLLGAFLSDIFWGKYKTIIRVSMIYILGHLVLALNESVTGVLAGCFLIALGSGGIKPCVSAHVGDQFDSSNSNMYEKVFNWFYLAINAGAVIAYLTAEPLLKNYGVQWAFGIPAILMAIATFIFWLGRKKFVSIKPAGWQAYKKDLFTKEGWDKYKRLIPMYFVFIAIFWSLFDQTGGAWVEQAQSNLMIKDFNIFGLKFSFDPTQVGFFNPLLIVLMIPLFTAMIYPFLRKRFNAGYIKKIAIGMFIAIIPFAIMSWVQMQMDAGQPMHIAWQLLGYFFLTAAEILVSVAALEFAYTQAPKRMKSFIMSFYLLSVAIGNFFTAMFNYFIQDANGNSMITGAQYFWFFTILMAIAAVAFTFFYRNFEETLIVQDKEDIELQ